MSNIMLTIAGTLILFLNSFPTMARGPSLVRLLWFASLDGTVWVPSDSAALMSLGMLNLTELLNQMPKRIGYKNCVHCRYCSLKSQISFVPRGNRLVGVGIAFALGGSRMVFGMRAKLGAVTKMGHSISSRSGGNNQGSKIGMDTLPGAGALNFGRNRLIPW